jgi:hypothetical protein
MEKPKMMPVPIETKGKMIWTQIWRWVTTIRKWELAEDWEYKLPEGGPVVVIPKGFTFNGTTVPRPLWAILSPTGLLLIPSLIHDFAYRYDYLWAVDSEGFAHKYKEGAGRWAWDLMFWKVGVKEVGMSYLNAVVWLLLVSFGWWSWRSKNDQETEDIAPSNKPIRSR